MDNKPATQILCVIDESGSMGGLRQDVIGGFNTFLADQKKLPDPAELSLVTFNAKRTDRYLSKPLAEVEELTPLSYAPNYSTALLDALGASISALRARTPKGAKVVVTITTDGEENASVEWTRDKVRKLIEETTAEGWEYFFFGANQDAFHEAKQYGIAGHKAANFAATADGLKDVYATASTVTASVRGGATNVSIPPVDTNGKQAA